MCESTFYAIIKASSQQGGYWLSFEESKVIHDFQLCRGVSAHKPCMFMGQLHIGTFLILR